MRVGSLFAGIGGFDLGFERAGMTTAWQVEIDPKCRELLAARFPHARQFDDVTTCGAHNLEPVDVVCGGFPCQDLSVAGKRAGLAGARSGLFYEMVRIADELKAPWLVWENVPGLLSSHRGRDFAAVLVELERVGYRGCWTTLDARYFGVAQRRRRIFGVFARGGSGAERAAQVLALAARLRGNPAPGREARAGTSAEPAVGFALRSDPGGTGQGHNTNYVTPALQAGSPTYERGDGALFCVPQVAWALCQRDSKGPDSDTKDGHLIVQAHALEASDGNHGRSSPRGDGCDNLVPANGVRRLTPTECERLQGFPDGWTEGFSDTIRYRMLGNAVAVPCAAWIGRRLVTVAADQWSNVVVTQ